MTAQQPGPFRQVLRGAARDAAVEVAAQWIIEHGEQPLGDIAERFNLSITAAAEARVLAERLRDGGADASTE